MAKKNKRQPLTTFIGGVIDSMSYGKLALCIGLVLLFGSMYFWLLNQYGHGTNTKDLSWPDSLYFCVITFSSLGYGDISPSGFGKIVAAIEVMSGLILVAVFVGKIASERQSAMLRLVYTSEHQRRLIDFEKEIYELESQIDKALDEHNHDRLYSLSRNVYRFIASIHNYLHFQANQGGLASFGNNSTLRRLYQSISELQVTIYDAIRTHGIQKRTTSKFEQVITRVNGIAKTMSEFHREDAKINSLLIEIQNTLINLQKWKEQFSKGEAEINYRNIVTDYLLNKVKERLPNPPWPKHIQKTIASDLEIQNNLAQKCIDQLIREGHFSE